ncbi:hypothetical protein NE237_025781 [Protea cynaroides]|uniref:tRNA(Ile)-lysidine synthetase n=1 Tax=Protea cynaroides TaxID=273540 RepID=A0A9Q0K1N3_9MAGN|nr:hypothetical protein NE237_025781 [Protea cynaroides]
MCGDPFCLSKASAERTKRSLEMIFQINGAPARAYHHFSVPFLTAERRWKPEMLSSLRIPQSLPLNRFFCKCSELRRDEIDMAKNKEIFARRMAMAGLKPHHRIALGVSGGPDSVALCVLTAGWKNDALVGTEEATGYINGLLAIIVDHGLRAESKDEANCVRDRVSKMGIRCEIVPCNWPDGRPKLGHLQEAARDMRYQILQNICLQNYIGVLLIAHHSDDQAELFVLRLSRNSGVLGLAGMAFTSQLFSSYTYCSSVDSTNQGILLVRPLLEFSKEDMYKICQEWNQEWVEDPTNQSPLFARNRIRMSLKKILSGAFRSEIQAVISACQRTRSFVDKLCYNLISQAVTIMAHGYAVVDLEKLDPSNVKDICLTKFVALILQFISQRHRPVRGRTSQLLLDYIRTFPCKNSLTAAGCYLCAAPGSKGTKIIVCCSPNSEPPKMESSWRYFYEEQKHSVPSEIDQIIADGRSYSEKLVSDESDVLFLDANSSEYVLNEAKRLHILSDLSHRSILSLQQEETKHFRSKTEVMSEPQIRLEKESVLNEPLESGSFCHFMNRFLVTWKLCGTSTVENTCYQRDSECQSQYYRCRCCVVDHGTAARVRYMIDADWLYLSKLSKCQITEECQQQKIPPACKKDQVMDRTKFCSESMRLSAQLALKSLKSIPVSARRSLPVLVNSQGLLLSIPSIFFKHCPNLTASAIFKPRVPLGGGHSLFI